jgi:MFS family permease
MPSIINFEQVLGTFATGFLLIKFGRKTILQFGTLMGGVGNILMFIGFVINNASDDPNANNGQFFVLIGLFLYMGVFGISLGPIVWLYIPEIVEAKVIPFSTATNWITASMIIILFPILTENVLNNNPSALFAVFAAWCFGSFVLQMKFVVETKDKPEKVIR